MPETSMSGPAPILLYDGHCLLCAWTTRFVLAHEATPDIQFVAITSELGYDLALNYGVYPKNPLTFLFIHAGWALDESDAALAIAARLRWPWRALTLARIIPRPLRNAAYRFIARRRYRLFGRSEACVAPSPQMRARFTLPGDA